VGGVLESAENGAGEVWGAWWGFRGEFAGDARAKPIGDAAGGVRDRRDAEAAGFETDEAERFRPGAGDGEQVDPGHEVVPLSGADPAECFRGESTLPGAGEHGITVGTIAGDDELEGATERGLGFNESGGEVIEAFLSRDAAEEEDATGERP